MNTQHVTIDLPATGFRAAATTRGHVIVADEPLEKGGTNAGATPKELLLAAMGSCTAITLRIYAERKGWDLQAVSVVAHREDDGEVMMDITVTGEIDEEQRERLEIVAGKCPVVKAVSAGIPVTKRLTVRA